MKITVTEERQGESVIEGKTWPVRTIKVDLSHEPGVVSFLKTNDHRLIVPHHPVGVFGDPLMNLAGQFGIHREPPPAFGHIVFLKSPDGERCGTFVTDEDCTADMLQVFPPPEKAQG